MSKKSNLLFTIIGLLMMYMGARSLLVSMTLLEERLVVSFSGDVMGNMIRSIVFDKEFYDNFGAFNNNDILSILFVIFTLSLLINKKMAKVMFYLTMAFSIYKMTALYIAMSYQSSEILALSFPTIILFSIGSLIVYSISIDSRISPTKTTQENIETS